MGTVVRGWWLGSVILEVFINLCDSDGGENLSSHLFKLICSEAARGCPHASAADSSSPALEPALLLSLSPPCHPAPSAHQHGAGVEALRPLREPFVRLNSVS